MFGDPRKIQTLRKSLEKLAAFSPHDLTAQSLSTKLTPYCNGKQVRWEGKRPEDADCWQILHRGPYCHHQKVSDLKWGNMQ